MSYIVEKDWTTQAGLRAVVVVHRHRCGYVEVLANHPGFGKTYDEQLDCITQEQAASVCIGQKSSILLLTASCSADNENAIRRSLDIIIDVHGGLTYAGAGIDSDYPVPSKGWWFGFDCAHYGDAPVEDPEGWYRGKGIIRSLEFCEAQCESMAEQLMALVSQ
jgi:hypothetical protein